MAGHLPAVGHAITLHRNAIGALQQAEREHGSFVQVHLGFGNWYLFCLGSEAFELLRHEHVAVGQSRASLEYLLGHSLLTQDGAVHKRVRSAMSSSFSPRGLMESGAPRLVSETVLRHVQALLDGGGDVHARMQAMALDVMFRIVGVEAGSLEQWRAKYRRVFWGLVPIPGQWPGSPRYFALRAAAWINEQLQRMVQQARESAPQATAQGKPESLLHALVRARDEHGRPLEDRELVDNLRLLFIAGHETTATTMTWATLHLAERPDLVRRLQDEAAAAADERPLCEGVFREAARLYSPAWFIERRLTGDVDYRGRNLAAGTTIAVCPPLWARDPVLYPDPEAFEPDRWLGRATRPTAIELSAFGGGPHFCLGYHLSRMESLEYIASLALGLRDAGARLRLATPRMPTGVYFPMPRPSPAARVVVEPV